jgi:hypothetical protein
MFSWPKVPLSKTFHGSSAVLLWVAS